MLEEFQSAYKCYHHSTETALVRDHYDILKTVDDNKSVIPVILLLLHLSAAFDTVDYTILVSRLANRFGISETALNWFGSNLQLRKQFVTVNGIDSSLKDLQYGVLQGSCVSSFSCIHFTRVRWMIQPESMAYHFIGMQMKHDYISRLRLTAQTIHPTRRRQLSCVLQRYW